METMKVFVSWSGEKSRQVAAAIKEWLPDLVQSVDVFMSQHDIEAGSRWGNELGMQLQECNFGIICITPENISASWLLYEAGCLGKSIDQSRVIPYRIGITATDVPFPLAQFQSVNADKDGTFKLLESINSVISSKLDSDRLQRIFQKFWPDLEKKLSEISMQTQSVAVQRADRELLEELLQLMRGIDRDLKRIPDIAKAGSENSPADDPEQLVPVIDKAVEKPWAPKQDTMPKQPISSSQDPE